MDGPLQPTEPLCARTSRGTGGIQEAVKEEFTIHSRGKFDVGNIFVKPDLRLKSISV